MFEAVKYFYVFAYHGDIQKRLIPEAELIPIKTTVDPSKMVGRNRVLGFSNSVSVKPSVWKNLLNVYRDWGKENGFSKQELIMLRSEQDPAQKNCRYELVQITKCD